MNSTGISKRIEYIDLARCVAILLVALNHAVNKSFSIYSGATAIMLEYDQMPFALTALKSSLFVLSRIGVPFFLMITGALMLGRDYSEDKSICFLQHNWLPLIITTEIWLVIMFWFMQLLPGSVLKTEGLANCLSRFITTLCFINPVTLGNMWYMPMILCVYLMIPVFSTALKAIPHRYFMVPVAIVLVSTFLLADVNAAFTELRLDVLEWQIDSVNLFSFYLVYVLAGFCIQQGYFQRFGSGLLCFISILGFTGAVAFQMWFYSRGSEFVLDYNSLLILLLSVPAFELLRRRRECGAHTRALTEKTAGMAFGIYFVHRVITEAVDILMRAYLPNIVHFQKLLIIWVLSFFGSIAVIMLFGKTRRIRKYMFGMKD